MALSPVPLACVPEAWPGEDSKSLVNSKLNKTSSYIAQPADEIFIVEARSQLERVCQARLPHMDKCMYP